MRPPASAWCRHLTQLAIAMCVLRPPTLCSPHCRCLALPPPVLFSAGHVEDMEVVTADATIQIGDRVRVKRSVGEDQLLGAAVNNPGNNWQLDSLHRPDASTRTTHAPRGTCRHPLVRLGLREPLPHRHPEEQGDDLLDRRLSRHPERVERRAHGA